MDENKLLRTNEVRIVGKLVGADVKTGVDKRGNNYVYVKGTVSSVINGVTNTYVVSFRSNEMTKDGTKVSDLYKAYVALPELLNHKVEVSAVLEENRQWNERRGQLVSSQLIRGRFVNGVLDTTEDEATYSLGGFINGVTKRTNKEGQIYRYDLELGQSNYSGDNMNIYVAHINPEDTEIVKGVQGYTQGMTIEVRGILSFVEETVTVQDENSGFGRPMVRTYTNYRREFPMVSGSKPFTDDRAYSQAIIIQMSDAYKAKDVERMSAINNKPAAAATNAAPVTNRQASLL